jgi:hypothetical protein
MAAVSLREPDINNKYSTIKNNIKYVCNNLSLDDLKKLPATPIDCKGTISIIPYCVTNQNVFFLLALNHLISNKKHNFVIESIGGDLQYDEKPYDTFISKLGNKVPKYATLIIQSLDAQPQYTEILSIKSNPIADLYGWKVAGQKAAELANATNSNGIAVQNWTLGSRAAWYAKPIPVFVLDQRQDQFDLWFGQIPRGAKIILVNWSGMPFSAPIGPKMGFEACQPLDSLEIRHFGQYLSKFDFSLCSNWQDAGLAY